MQIAPIHRCMQPFKLVREIDFVMSFDEDKLLHHAYND